MNEIVEKKKAISSSKKRRGKKALCVSNVHRRTYEEARTGQDLPFQYPLPFLLGLFLVESRLPQQLVERESRLLSP